MRTRWVAAGVLALAAGALQAETVMVFMKSERGA
jgi:hypothetical protein